MADYSFEEQQSITKQMSDKIYNDSYTTTEEELVKDTNWIQASKDVYKELEGVEWSGSDEDAAKKGLDMMSRFNYNLTLGTINYTAQLQDANDQTKLSFYYLMDMYDKKDISGNGVLRAFKEMGLDPASYIGIGTLGLGFAGKQAAAVTAKTGLKEMLKQGAIKYLQSATAVGATEAAIYTSADDFARQQAAIGAGFQDEYSPGQTAVAGAVGATVGAGFVQGTKAIGKGINKVITAGEEEMAKMAGGGTPPILKDTKVIDNSGNPLTVYHGTTKDFKEFKRSEIGTSTDSGMYGDGFYFTANKEKAKGYAKSKGVVKEVTLDLKNPYIINSKEDIPNIDVKMETLEDMENADRKYSIAFREYLQQKGYDGVIDNMGEKYNQIVVFDPSQIKGAKKPTATTDVVSKFQDDVNAQISKHGDLYQLDYNMMDISDRDLTRIQRAKQTIEEIQSDPENAVYTASNFKEFQEYYPDQLKYAKIVPQIKGNKVKIYRSATGDIEPGDWIGLSKQYAESHGRTPEHKTYEMWVDKEDIRWQGADANEWIYLPKDLINADIDFQGAK